MWLQFCALFFSQYFYVYFLLLLSSPFHPVSSSYSWTEVKESVAMTKTEKKEILDEWRSERGR
jgi:hypothetical protein